MIARERPLQPLRPATVLEIDDGFCIPFPSQGQVLTAQVNDADIEVGQRLACDIEPGSTYLIWPEVGELGVGGAHAREGHYSQQWKEVLRVELRSSKVQLARRLRAAGVELAHLEQCLEYWSKSATTVIHAPQQSLHFRKLIEVLGIEENGDDYPRPRGTTWWRSAWGEIARARGNAIQHGMQEHEILDEALRDVLASMKSQIARAVQNDASFSLRIAEGEALEGIIRFYRILGVEEGLRVPQTLLKERISAAAVNAWR
jgi:hypothetical protein